MATFLDPLCLDPSTIALMFLPQAIAYTIAAVPCGYLVDKFDSGKSVLVTGLLLSAISLGVTGTLSVFLLDLHKPLWILGSSEIIFGLAMGTFNPLYQGMVDVAVKNGS